MLSPRQSAPLTGRLSGKVAVVTGAGSGLGAAIARRFCAEGARVVLADISGQQDAVAEQLGKACSAIHCDVAVSSDVQAMLAVTISRYGRLDILCNNAGIAGPIALTADCDEDVFDHIVAVNLRGVFLGMKYAIPLMLQGGGGSIINTSSIAALVAFPGMPAYCASKGGVSMLTKLTAAEYAGKGIRVNAILPGVFDTGMTQGLPAHYIAGAAKATLLGRIGDASEIANLALLLASDESSFMTGTLTPVDGGFTLV